MNSTASIVSKVWSFYHTLRDDGVNYGDYLSVVKAGGRANWEMYINYKLTQ